jgi:O-antigen ligase
MSQKTFDLTMPDRFSALDAVRSSPLFILFASALGVLISMAVSQFGWLTLALIPVAAMAFTALSRPTFGLMALVIVIFAQIQRVFTEFLNLPGPGQPLVGFLILVSLIRFLIFDERAAGWLKNTLILGMYLIFLVLSVTVAQEAEPAMEELFDLAQNILIASLVIYILRDFASLKTAVWAVILAGLLMGAVSVFQNVTNTYDNPYWGLGGSEFSGYVGRPRATGPYMTPNPYAQVLVVIFILALDRTWHETKIPLRLLAGGSALLCALALIFTDSRGGIANLAFTLFVFFLFNRPNLNSLIVVGVFALVVARFLPNNFFDRLMTLTELFDNNGAIYDESFRGRTSENIAARMMFADHPFFGVGLNNYSENYLKYSREIGLDPRREQRDPASLYLQLLAEQGLIGFTVFIFFVVSIFVRLFKAHKDFKALNTRDEMYLTSALFAALAGYMFMSLYKNNAYSNVFWTLVGMCISAAQIAANHAGSEDNAEKF